MQNQNPPLAIIVGAGPAGLAAATCLCRHSIPYIILEREDCYAPIFKKFSYDRLSLHLGKEICELPFMPFPSSYPTFVPKESFIKYLDDYVTYFGINPLYQRLVESACFDEVNGKWIVRVKNGGRGDEIEEYSAKYLIVASGEASNPFVPEVEGLSGFNGEVLHSTKFKNGKGYKDKNVLVVGCGNSGMEIALDLANHGAKTSMAVRSPFHILPRDMAYWAFKVLFKFVSPGLAERLVVMLSKLVYGDMTQYGISRPAEGPFFLKDAYGKYPVLDVGTCRKIRSGEIQVLPALRSINGNEVLFENGKTYPFDAIIFCTGFKSSTREWLKGDDYLLNEDGIAKPSHPNRWKGKNGLYCVGLSRKGLNGIKVDAQNIANDIKSLL